MEVYESESKGVRAQLRLDGRKIVVVAGSHAVGDSQIQPSLGEKPSRRALRAELIRSGRLVVDGADYRFAEDVEFNSPSEAASIIWGSNLNGRKVFGIDEGRPSTHVLHFQIDSQRAIEGYKRDQILYLAARDRALADQRKQLDNFSCRACGLRLSVENRFVIECHHLNPISLGQRDTSINDLVALCPTCHRIAHMREPIYSVEEIARLRGACA